MLTIKHTMENGLHYVTVNNPDYRTYYNFAIADYAIGWRKPNYPMPALPVDHEWFEGELRRWYDLDVEHHAFRKSELLASI